MARGWRKVRGRVVATLAVGVLGVGAVVWGSNGGGGGGGAGTANLWIDGSGGTCTRSASPAAYSDAAACTWTNALSNSAAGDTVLVRDGTYTSPGLLTTSKTSPGVAFKAENPNGVTLTGQLRVSTGDWLSFEDFIIDGTAGCDSIASGGGCTNITFKQNRINGEASSYAGTAPNVNLSFIGNYINEASETCSSSEDCDATRLWGSANGLLYQDNLLDGHVKTATGHTDFFQACSQTCGGSGGNGIKFVGNWLIHGQGNQGIFIKDGTYTNCEASDNLMVNIGNINGGTATPIQIYPCTPNSGQPFYTGYGVKMDHNTMVGNGATPIVRDCPSGGNYRMQRNVFSEMRAQQDASSCNYTTWLASDFSPNQLGNVMENTGNVQAITANGDTTSDPIFINNTGASDTGNMQLASSSPNWNSDVNVRAGITWDPTTKVFGPQ